MRDAPADSSRSPQSLQALSGSGRSPPQQSPRRSNADLPPPPGARGNSPRDRNSKISFSLPL
jgi:hypothetical protein